MATAQVPEPHFSQKRLPLMLTQTNINARADITFTSPKIPVRNRAEDTEVNPAERKIMGESKACQRRRYHL